jgi:hypothetical protein
MSELSIFEKLSQSTIRIECELRDGKVSTGTGFFVKFVECGDTFVPVIVTNKHVVQGAIRCNLFFTLSDDNGNPTHDRHHRFEIIDFAKPWIDHPDPNIDLCAMPINVFIDQMQKMGIKPYITFLDLSILPTHEDIEEMAGMERVVMVGYPNGLWDAKHNQPVFRSGVLASHYRFDWNGKPEFLIDAACTPGSSGSPVLIIDIGQVFTKKGMNIGSSRIKFLGVLYAGPFLAADGSIEVIPAPTADTIRTLTNIPINLGYVIKSNKLLDFEAVFERELGKSDR